MIIGIPSEIKPGEFRVGATHYGAAEFSRRNHEVLVEEGAGAGSGITDEMYREAGAKTVPREEVFRTAEMILKVKEPQEEEYSIMRKGQILFAYLHLAAEEKLTDGILESGCTAIAFETVTDEKGRLPLLTPMSTIAGRMSVQAGAHFLQKPFGGKGVLLSGSPGVKNGKVVVIGGGAVGINAARIALGMGAEVYVFETGNQRLREIDEQHGNRIHALFSTEELLLEHLENADLVIGAVLVPGSSAPKVVKREHLKLMQKGTVIVDVAIDQGGCFETSKPTTHGDPVFVVDDIPHYCVANMPGAVSRTSTFALANNTLPFALKIADMGWKRALREDEHLLGGLNAHEGRITCKPVADSLGRESTDPSAIVA